MTRIVKHHVPASDLPEDWRGGIPPTARVTVVVEEEVEADPTDPLDLLARARASLRGPGITTEEAVRRVRDLRDEWDD